MKHLTGYYFHMCRSLAEGGRRCPCGKGSRRRAYQRARYALKAAESLVPPISPDSVQGDPSPTIPSHTEAQPVYRDPAPSRQAVMESLSKLRSELSYDEWRNSDQMKEYVSATITHGAVLRDNALAETEKMWTQAGVSDEQVAELIRLKREHEATRAEAKAESDRLLNEWDKFKEDNPEWHSDPVLKARADELGDAYANYYDSWTQRSQELNRKLLEVNTKRRALFTKAVVDTLAAERDLGGKPFTADSTKLTRKDAQMVEGVVNRFPSEMIEFANARGIALHLRRSKRRAHYVSRTRRKQKVTKAGVLNAADAVRGDKYWYLKVNYENLSGTGLTDSHVSTHQTVEDTPDNRAILEERVADYIQQRPRLPKEKTPVITEVDFGGVKRLALHVPEAYSRFSTSESPIVGELTFSDDASVAHEFGHHLEYNNPEISFACKEFLQRRTEGLEKVVYHRSSKGTEWVTPDGFVDSYIGKHYNDTHHTEVFSMGVEALMTGAHGGLLGVEVDTSGVTRSEDKTVPKRHKADPEHFALIMGLLSSANKKTD